MYLKRNSRYNEGVFSSVELDRILREVSDPVCCRHVCVVTPVCGRHVCVVLVYLGVRTP